MMMMMKRTYWIVFLLLSSLVAVAQRNFNDTVPPPPPGSVNVKFQLDSTGILASAYVPNSGYGICSGLSTGMSPLGNAYTPGLQLFGPSNYWNQDISASPVDPASSSIIAFINSFGSSSASVLTIQHVAITSNVLTLTGTFTGAPLAVGRSFTISGATTATFLNTAGTLTISSVIGGVLAPTGITASFTHANYTSATDTGTATTTGNIVYFHPDFGSANGVPFSIVDSAVTPLRYVTVPGMFTHDFDQTQSDYPAFPIPVYAPIEGLPGNCANSGTDQHGIILDKNTCFLFEIYQAVRCNGDWTGSCSAIWDMTNYNHRPPSVTSVDAAGLPVFPGLVRYDETVLGAINHAFRATFYRTHAAYVSPATHWAGNDSGIGYLSPIPMGMRLRLKASYNISGFSIVNQIILTALKTYGLINADNGGSLYVTGAIDGRWNDSDLHALNSLSANDFEVIQMGPWYKIIDVGDNIAVSGCTVATQLNGQTFSSTTHNGWNGFSASSGGIADFAQVSDTTCSGNITINPALPGTLPGPWIAPFSTVQIVGGVLTVAFQRVGVEGYGANIPSDNTANPVISSFTATPSSVAAGDAVTLAWSTSGESYKYLTQSPTTNPQVGVTRDTSVVVHPTVTTTYTLNALNGSNQYAWTTASVTVTVH